MLSVQGAIIAVIFLLMTGVTGCTVSATPTPLPPTTTSVPTHTLAPTPDIQATVTAAVAEELARQPTSTPIIIQVVATPTPGPTSTPVVKEVIKQIVVTPTPTITSAQTPISPIGLSRAAPADIGTALLFKVDSPFSFIEARVTLLEVIRGEEAWNRIQEASRTNIRFPPKSGFEYLLARVRFEYSEGKNPDTSRSVYPSLFKTVTTDGRAYDIPALTGIPEPSFRAELYPGTSHEGWVALQVPEDDDTSLMTFETFSGQSNLWWKLYE